MLEAFWISTRLRISYRVNGILFWLKRIPLLGKRLPAVPYQITGLKRFALVLAVIWELLTFFVGKLLESALLGVLCFIGCLAMGFDSPLLIAVIMGVTNLIPFFGQFIGAIPCALLLLLENPIHCLMFIIFIVVLQQLLDMLIQYFPAFAANRVAVFDRDAAAAALAVPMNRELGKLTTRKERGR